MLTFAQALELAQTWVRVVTGDNHGYPVAPHTPNNEYRGYWALQLEQGGLGVAKPRADFYRKGVWLCPSAQWYYHNVSADKLSSYGYNAFGVLPVGNLTNTPGLFGHYGLGSGFVTPISESEVSVPSDMMSIGDGNGFVFLCAENWWRGERPRIFSRVIKAEPTWCFAMATLNHRN